MQNIRELGALSLEYWPEPDQRVKLTMIIGGEFAPESNLSILNLHIYQKGGEERKGRNIATDETSQDITPFTSLAI